MSVKNELYYCKHCHKLAEVAIGGSGFMSCCGEVMTLLQPNTTDASQEKHVPIIVDKDDCIEVKVGGVDHPMTVEHHIVFIEVITGHGVYRKYFKPGDPPHFHFPYKNYEIIQVRTFCNLHMLWSDD